MAMAAPPELDDPGYTPGRRALPELLGTLGDCSDEARPALERAICRAGAAAVPFALEALESAAPERRAALLALLARLATATRDARLYPALVAALGDPSAAARKWAARGLGKLGDERAEPALLSALSAAPVLEQKSLVDALANVGGEASQAALSELASDDADLSRRIERARLLLERRLARRNPAALVMDRALPEPWRVVFRCRAGLAAVLAEELAGWAAVEVRGADAVAVEHRGTLADLLAPRTALQFGFVLPLAATVQLAPLERIAATLASPSSVALLSALTRGAPRMRFAWSDGRHHRAEAWALAGELRRRTSALLNDSQQALWTAQLPRQGGDIELVPRFESDPRFDYRRRSVPWSSHPTLAAALARLAGARADDVVWDPFAGSGTELLERARLGPVRELWGTDTDANALEAARANAAAAGILGVHWVQADALTFTVPGGASLILTNPPMGRRLARDGSITPLLERFVAHAAEVLRPSGRLIWLSPLAQKTARAAERGGLRVSEGPEVDMGGFAARLQTLTRPA